MLSSHSHALPRTHAAERHGWASASNTCSRPLASQDTGHCRGIQGASAPGGPRPCGASQSTLRHGVRRQRQHMQLCAIASESLPSDAHTGEYDAAANASVWERRPVPVISRLISIGVEFVRWQIQNPDDPPPRNGAAAAGLRSPRKSRRAAAMRELLVKLGPAFVKIGQALSSRPDVLPPAYLVELEALQDRIPAFETSQAFIVLENELGAPLPAVFREISPQPIAAASLGQVYRAVLARDGQVVAVKVQRPGVAEAIALDVYILRWLAAAFRQLRKLNTDLPALVDEWATSLFRELDYRREARNAQRFKELYSSLDGVYVPAVLPELTTTKVLTMEWVDGERLRTVADNLAEATDPMSIRRTSGARASTSGSVGTRGSSKDLELVEVGVRCSLEQMLEQGFYHADPHPGNLMRTRDGKLAYLDFGMCGELDAKTSQALIRATLHLVNREFSSLAQDFIDLGLLPPGSDKDKIIPALTGVFQTALARGVSNVSFGDLSGQLGRTMYQFSFRIPPYYTLLVRSLTVLEGIALASDPNYKVLGSAYPWIARRLLTNRNPELQETLRALLYTPAGNFRFARLESLLQEAVRVPRESPKLQGPAPPGTELRPGQEGSALSLLLSPDASFVRDILVDELAKGIDAGWRVGLDQALNAARHPLPYVAGVPVFGSFLVPLFAPLTTHVPAPAQRFGSALSSWASRTFGSTPQHRLEDRELAGPVGALLAALPELSSRRDKEQVAGLQRLATALGALVAKRAQVTAATSQSPMLSAVGGEAPDGLAGLLADPAAAISQLQQAAEGLRWFLAELSSLPQAQRDEAMKLPAELAARLASRVTARAIRGLFGEVDTSNEEIEEVVVTTTTVAGPAVVVVDSNTGNARAFGGMQDTLAGSSIV